MFKANYIKICAGGGVSVLEASVDGWVDIFPCREATLLLWLLFYRHFYELL